MDNFYTRCVLTPGRSPACHGCMAGSPRECRLLQDQAVSLLFSCQPPHCHPQSHPAILKLATAAWLLEPCLLASVVHATRGHADWDPSGGICCVLMQRSPACLRVKGMGISAANDSLAHPKERSARIKYRKWRLLWRAGEGLQCHTALAATVVVFSCKRHKGYAEKSHKHNDWKCGTC